MIICMVNYNLVKRKIRFRWQKSDFHRAFRERIFPRSKVYLVTLLELALCGFLQTSLEKQDAEPVTSLHLALLHQTLDNLFIYGEKILYKQEEAFWR